MATIRYLITFLLLISSINPLAAGHRNIVELYDPPSMELPYNQWRIISLPATPDASSNTVEAILGDDLGLEGYRQNWVIYAFNTDHNSYEPLALTDRMEKGKGYWIIHIVDKDKSLFLDMPVASRMTSSGESIPLVAVKEGSTHRQWTLAGNPFAPSLTLDSLRLVTDAPSCNGCNIDTAEEERLLHNEVWTYNGNDYVKKGMGTQVNIWEGFWALALEGSKNYALGLVSPTPCLPRFRLEDMIANDEDVTMVDTSCITDMSYLLFDTKNHGFDQDISLWDVSNVTNMTWMFAGAFFNPDLSSWDVSNVTNMEDMFIESHFNQDLSLWNVSNVTNMRRMFGGNWSFNQDLSSWDVSNVMTMENMFDGTISLSGRDFSGWDVSKVTAHKCFLGDKDGDEDCFYHYQATGKGNINIEPNWP